MNKDSGKFGFEDEILNHLYVHGKMKECDFIEFVTLSLSGILGEVERVAKQKPNVR